MSDPETGAREPVEERPKGTRWRTLLVVGLTAVLLGGGGWWVTRPAADAATAAGAGVPAAAPVVGGPAPPLAAVDVEGRTVTLDELRGRPVWVTFGASWCAPCRVEAPDIQAAYAAGSAEGVQVVAVYLGEEAEAVRQFAQTLGLTYTHIPDPARELAAAWGVRGIPVHYFLDAAGTVRAIHVGIVGPDRIGELLAQAAH